MKYEAPRAKIVDFKDSVSAAIFINGDGNWADDNDYKYWTGIGYHLASLSELISIGKN
jgi:hypothetical protein